MENIENTTNTQEIQPDKKAKSYSGRRKCAVTGFILTVLAWCSMAWLDWLAVALVVIALIVSAIGCRIPRGGRRNLAITSIVAGSALLIAVIAIWIGLAIIV